MQRGSENQAAVLGNAIFWERRADVVVTTIVRLTWISAWCGVFLFFFFFSLLAVLPSLPTSISSLMPHFEIVVCIPSSLRPSQWLQCTKKRRDVVFFF